MVMHTALSKASLLFLAFVVAFAGTAAVTGAQKEKTKSKAKKQKSEPLDVTGRPEGGLAAKHGAKSARYYVWYDKQGWHLRSTAGGTRRFHGTVRVKDGKIASVLSVGLKGDGKKSQDAWRVDSARKELAFDFRTSTASDGLDIKIDGDQAELEFDLLIDNQKRPQRVFLGRKEQHPAELPLKLKSVPDPLPKTAEK